MSKRNPMISPVLAASLSLGLLAVAGQAWAVDPPPQGSKMESDEPVTDTWITTKVKSDLLATRNVSGTDIKVETRNGVVSLSGTVKSQAERDKAVATARAIKGVKSVDASGLEVGGR
ncbi:MULTISPECIES: BON domain-containing protein [Gammaproteobacteria]|jgi:hyperosmotically inducible protein|uniref:BON domain-containing protein n=1 Tax=Gammaproteobacteria TaxID=1236 RepID=UPI002113A46B|nr:BON domain-containing protein [Pseudomonas sp. Hp2]